MKLDLNKIFDNFKKQNTIISKDDYFKGSFSFKNDVYVEGNIEAEKIDALNIICSESSVINSKSIVCNNLTISGDLTSKVYCNKFTLENSGNFTGEVHYKTSAKINGSFSGKLHKI